MKHLTKITAWAHYELINQGYTVQHEPEVIIRTPWSTVLRLKTTDGDFILKHTPPALFLEPQILNFLSERCHAAVPDLIAMSSELHCFIMGDVGENLRGLLKSSFSEKELIRPITEFTSLQRSTENNTDALIDLGVPDWRLCQLPILYEQMIHNRDFLNAEGVSDEELNILNDLRPKLEAQCDKLSRCSVPETMVQPDFNTNNVLFNRETHALTFIDMGEISISHPFFSLLNYLLQATLHHGVNENDPLYHQLQQACIDPWLDLASEQQLAEALVLAKELWPIYNVLALYRLMVAVDQQAFQAYYAHRPKRISDILTAWRLRCPQ